jgi:glycosyltransferase involved in cell wall biosynthesis
MGRFLFFFALSAAILFGYGAGSGYFSQERLTFYPPEVGLVKSLKPFTIVLIANNDGPTVKRALRSIFEQEYDNYRLVFVDDGSRDDTFERVNEFVVANRQEHRVILVKNEIALGFESSLHRAASQCLDAELILPLKAADWLVSSTVLSRLNSVFQTTGVWVVSTGAIRYPSYECNTEGLYCFYGALFKRIDQTKIYPKGLLSLTKSKVKKLPDRLLFSNETL